MENRKHKRFKIANLSKIEDHDYSIINISKEGILLSTNFEPANPDAQPDKTVNIQLKVNGKWVDLEARVMWVLTDKASDIMSMGVFISKAPQAYNNFIDNLYLEANEK
ncbi:MAG: PilZ domain-containing protein [bacterium]|nr:PilZ domain-containing protein [bacterium]